MELWDRVRVIVPRVYFGAGKFTEGEEVTGMITSFGADCVNVHVPQRGNLVVPLSVCSLIVTSDAKTKEP